MTKWIEQAARCRRLAMITSDQRARDALITLADELDAKVAEARADPREFPERGGRPSRPAG